MVIGVAAFATVWVTTAMVFSETDWGKSFSQPKALTDGRSAQAGAATPPAPVSSDPAVADWETWANDAASFLFEAKAGIDVARESIDTNNPSGAVSGYDDAASALVRVPESPDGGRVSDYLHEAGGLYGSATDYIEYGNYGAADSLIQGAGDSLDQATALMPPELSATAEDAAPEATLSDTNQQSVSGEYGGPAQTYRFFRENASMFWLALSSAQRLENCQMVAEGTAWDYVDSQLSNSMDVYDSRDKAAMADAFVDQWSTLCG